MRANWTPIHEAFQDEIERLRNVGDNDVIEQIAYMLVRYLPASRLDEARQELQRDGIDVPPAGEPETEDDEPTVRQTCCVYCGLDIEGFSDQPTAWRDRGGNLHCSDTRRLHEPIEGIDRAFD